MNLYLIFVQSTGQGLLLFISLFQLLCTIYHRNHRWVSNRGFVIYFVLFIRIMISVSTLSFFDDQKLNCIIKLFTTSPFLCVLFYVYSFYLFRYLFMQWLETKKHHLGHSRKFSIQKNKWFIIRTIRFLTSLKFFIFGVFVFSCVWYIAFSILILFYHDQCPGWIEYVSSIIVFCFLILSILIMIFVFVLDRLTDFCCSRKENFCKECTTTECFTFKNGRFPCSQGFLLFRLEMYLLIGIHCMYLVVLILLTFFQNWSFAHVYKWVIDAIGILFYQYSNMIVCPGIILFHVHLDKCFSLSTWTCWKNTKKTKVDSANSISTTSSNPSIEETIQNPQTYLEFLEHCKNEFSSENLLCWKQMEEYKNQTQIDLRRAMGQLIWKTYLDDSCLIPVNVTSEQKSYIYTHLQKANKDLFNDCQFQLLANMSDTYTRFYKNYIFKDENNLV